MFKNDASFWVGIFLIIFGLSANINGVKEKTLICSKVTSLCSVETRNFLGYLEKNEYINLKSSPRVGFILTSMNSITKRRDQNYNIGYHRDRIYTRYCHLYNPVLMTQSSNIIFGGRKQICTNYYVPYENEAKPSGRVGIKDVYDQIYRDIENRNLIKQFNVFLSTPFQKEYLYKDTEGATVLKTLAYIFMGIGAFFLYKNAEFTRKNL